MSSIAITGGATGTGVFSLLAPSTSTNRTINLPDSNGTILTTATAGVPVNGPAFAAQITTVQTITANVNTKIIFGSEYFDTNSNYDTTTGRFQPAVAGYYQINAQLYFPANSASYTNIEIQRNGTVFATAATASQTFVAAIPSVSALIYCNGTTDFLEIYGASGMSGTISLSSQSRFSGALVRAA